ncbi:MAG: FAD-dependent oxidoreductase [Patescibacteria group bacterium]|nr:FAD-dependent oxidoreductase [Patescibacteria group bacterium]MDE1944876.1 FAD-dependent oxidoreductase [Patescibacteria group bacterium]MDE2057739.1 FAD-dependent oxidoreductase [Patescibacteria group bacterium]
MNDLIIVGGGPAGVAGGVYAARKRLKTLLVAEEIGGQSVVSEGIENWIGATKLSGGELAKSFEAQLEALAGAPGSTLELALGERAAKLERAASGFRLATQSGKTFDTHAVLIASGAGRRKLEVPGAEQFENKGLTYCASCDGPLFAGMDVAVVGGGNAGFETALQLLAYCKSVTLIHRHKEFKADPVTVEKAKAHANMHLLPNAEPVEVVGEQFVTGLKYKERDSKEVQLLPVAGIFVEAGVVPNTDFAKDLLALDAVGRIAVDAKSQRASVEGVWAAGDATDELYHQNNIAAGDGVKALEDIYLWLKKR